MKLVPIWRIMVFIVTGESTVDEIISQFQWVVWKCDKQKSVFSLPLLVSTLQHHRGISGREGWRKKMHTGGGKTQKLWEKSNIWKRDGFFRKEKKKGGRKKERKWGWEKEGGKTVSPSQIGLGQFVVTQRLPFPGTTTVNDVWQAHPYYWLSFTQTHTHTPYFLTHSTKENALCMYYSKNQSPSQWWVNKKLKWKVYLFFSFLYKTQSTHTHTHTLTPVVKSLVIPLPQFP